MTQKQNDFLNLIVYQIYPRSFNDSNNDGIGDLNGIIQKLDYLKDLGVNAVWLSPCYKSPNEDNGYDISDYRDIMDEFGTLDDWKRMINEMHKRGIKLIMDFVANHTSSQHKWFSEARKSKDNPYRDYYVWADEPLTDWESVFGGSAWEYDEATKQYYLHSFAVGQPDLNWENPKVQQEMIGVIDYWVNLGVDGFRCDVLDFISKDFANNIHSNGPRLHEFVNMLFGRPEVEHIFTVGECQIDSCEDIKLLIGGERGELSTVFQFDHINVGRIGRFEPQPLEHDEIKNMLVKWQNIFQDNDLVGTLFFENHDQPRAVSRFGDEALRYESATMLATMSFLQRGIPFIYQGQEIGCIDPYYENINDYDDIETINYYHMNPHGVDEEEMIKRINFGSRDNSRRPMPWNDMENCGFSGVKPWLTLHDKYKEINVEADLKSQQSVYRYFQKLIRLRTENEVFLTGKYKDVTNERKGIYLYKRYTDTENYLVICNFSNETYLNCEYCGEIVLSNTGRETVNGIYLPYECVIVKITSEEI